METESQSRSVHAFVDKKTGEVYKPASFKAPAKIVRYNLLMIESRKECFERADWAEVISMFADTDRQLRKLSIYKPMQFRVTQINIDFEDDNFELSPSDQQDVIEDVMSTTWEASDPDDLVEEITSATGFCVNSIDYCYVLK